MKTIIVALIAALIFVALMMAGLGIKMLMRKSKEFRRPCTNADPRTGRCTNCTCKKKELRTLYQQTGEGIPLS